ncbi:DsbA family protein, partial [Candidatus Azambacteria bacterium]|nr:DsbA family protein [Candidatus Azambacteria bacterium]
MQSEETSQNQNSNQNVDTTYLIPGSIILAGLIIAGAIYYSKSDQVNNRKLPDNINSPKETAVNVEAIKPVSSRDHILGNPKAPVKLIEFSDLECPFCKNFHLTLKKIMSEYGNDGRLAWIYRHFPLDAIHSQSRKEAVATECANDLGGNNKFWEYLDKVFVVTPSNNGLDLAILPRLAKEIGLDEAKFRICLESNRYDDHIQQDLDDAQNSGGNGTPFNVIIASNGKKFPFSGALPYD